jgi:hypothetical protein
VSVDELVVASDTSFWFIREIYQELGEVLHPDGRGIWELLNDLP